MYASFSGSGSRDRLPHWRPPNSICRTLGGRPSAAPRRLGDRLLVTARQLRAIQNGGGISPLTDVPGSLLGGSAVITGADRLGAGMSNSPDVQRTLDHCSMNIKGATEAMTDDMHDAATRLGAAAMMLASASHAVHKRAAQQTQAQTEPDTGQELGAEG